MLPPVTSKKIFSFRQGKLLSNSTLRQNSKGNKERNSTAASMVIEPASGHQPFAGELTKRRPRSVLLRNALYQGVMM